MNTKMKTLKITIIALLITSIGLSQQGFKRIDSLVNEVHKKNPTISFSVGFVKNKTEFYSSYGNLNKESTTKVDENSLFEIASITKILTSYLITQAALENELKLDDFIDNYLPKYYHLQKELQHKITISDLASHQSGLPDIDFKALIIANPQQPTNAVTKTTLKELVNNADALLDYGNYRYSTINYVLMGQILEQIYHKT
jgi:CubicO group peptidase (beta-lactamase class C family)